MTRSYGKAILETAGFVWPAVLFLAVQANALWGTSGVAVVVTFFIALALARASFLSHSRKGSERRARAMSKQELRERLAWTESALSASKDDVHRLQGTVDSLAQVGRDDGFRELVLRRIAATLMQYDVARDQVTAVATIERLRRSLGELAVECQADMARPATDAG